jgi:hypothetical protein
MRKSELMKRHFNFDRKMNTQHKLYNRFYHNLFVQEIRQFSIETNQLRIRQPSQS